MPKKRTIAIIVITALAVGLLSFLASWALTSSLKKQLAEVHQVKEFKFKNVDMQLKQVDLDDFSCFLIVYDSPSWQESRIFFQCPEGKK